eukprot:8897126-Pyramimonas_sp.AAC.1
MTSSSAVPMRMLARGFVAVSRTASASENSETVAPARLTSQVDVFLIPTGRPSSTKKSAF